MGIREDIRAALVGIGTSVPEAVHTLRSGDVQGTAVQTSARTFADALSTENPAEAARYVANAGTFGEVREGDAVTLDGSLRIVTSAAADAVGATVTFGLSAEFERCAATYTGARREPGRTRQLRLPVELLIQRAGVADGYGDALAPSYAEAWHAVIRDEDWADETRPSVGDSIDIGPGGPVQALKVSKAVRHDGYTFLQCRERR